jgi:hypothetical protein
VVPGFPPFQRVGEHAEFQSGTAGDESGEDVTAATWGSIFGISRSVEVADDANALEDVARTAAAALVALGDDLFWSLLASNPVMRDGNPFFSAAHGNLVGAGALSLTTLGSALALLRQQTSPTGARLTMEPRYLVVGPVNEINAREMLTKITPADGGTLLEVAVDAHITDSTYYLFADPTTRPAWVSGHIGSELLVTPRRGWRFDGVEFKAQSDIGIGPVDWRPAVRGPGV